MSISIDLAFRKDFSCAFLKRFIILFEYVFMYIAICLIVE